ncbi:MAG: TetR/AcrR family transcriptional regulator [Bifidobacteriaceae bacterium]|nr:TetR/AcrR family transcriptional regulator [Bifidobacteriaceae bacterium]
MTTANRAVANVRQRARELMTQEILDAAEVQLANVGAANLSLRAVARELGMASSAVYRYVPSRDALLTALLLRAYRDLGKTLKTAEAQVPREDLSGRMWKLMTTERRWALDNPQRWALLYGTPVPGYQAPNDTKDPAGTFFFLMAGVLRDANWGHSKHAEKPELEVSGALPDNEAVASAIAWVQESLGVRAPGDVVASGIRVWSWMVGAISAELWGHYVGIVDRLEEHYETGVEVALHVLGLRPHNT